MHSSSSTCSSNELLLGGRLKLSRQPSTATGTSMVSAVRMYARRAATLLKKPAVVEAKVSLSLDSDDVLISSDDVSINTATLLSLVRLDCSSKITGASGNPTGSTGNFARRDGDGRLHGDGIASISS